MIYRILQFRYFRHEFSLQHKFWPQLCWSNEESSAEIKLHKENHHGFCRICGKDRALAGLGGRNPVAKGEYEDIFKGSL